MTSKDGSKYRLKCEIDASGVTITGVLPKDVKDVVIPDEINGVPVTKIKDFAFSYSTELTSIAIPDSVTSIGDCAFYGCTGLTSITMPDCVTSIGSSAFSCCPGLASITIPDSVTSIGYEAFQDTAYYNNKSNWKNGVLYIGKHLIDANEEIADSYKILDGTLTIADSAFNRCAGLTSVYAPSVQYVGKSAFFGCGLLRNVELAPDACWDNTAFKKSKIEDEYCYNEEER